ncbi:50S ribosomal protein L25/general stress protein Ctc [Nafulsella turpanensis]|uniref:50S ribosomal protein L25/general stress protein Ctc n=1 Tax=Nafulsella turpanensis TaxID=1265690 RepID=UPI0004767FAE|nr:50S ribosomal protein L25/general stress protein Ctc [Nafulsella turpanensis]
MKNVEIIGFKRANLGKKESKDLRLEGNVPCVMYGGKDQIHFYAPMILFRDLVYTGDAHMVDLNIEGTTYNCILQDIQFHPVSETILHADFLQLFEKRAVKMDIPVKFEGTAPGVIAGGKMITKLRKITVKALPADMPDYITVDISKLALGKSVKVGEITPGNFEILNNPSTSIATVEIPRALRGKGATAEE